MLSILTAKLLIASVSSTSVISVTSLPGLAQRMSSFKSLFRQLKQFKEIVTSMDRLFRNLLLMFLVMKISRRTVSLIRIP